MVKQEILLTGDATTSRKSMKALTALTMATALCSPGPPKPLPDRPRCRRVIKGKKCKYHGGCNGYRRPCKWYLEPKK